MSFHTTTTEQSTSDREKAGTNMSKALQGDHHLIRAIIGNEIWARWGVGLQIPVLKYDFRNNKGSMTWTVSDDDVLRIKVANERARGFYLLHPFLNDSGMIADYQFTAAKKQLEVSFWFVSKKEKDLLLEDSNRGGF